MPVQNSAARLLQLALRLPLSLSCQKQLLLYLAALVCGTTRNEIDHPCPHISHPHLTRALMNADLPTLAAPMTYTSRPLLSWRMEATALDTPSPALELTCSAPADDSSLVSSDEYG